MLTDEYNETFYLKTSVMNAIFGLTVLIVGLVSLSSTTIQLKLEQLMRILAERDQL